MSGLPEGGPSSTYAAAGPEGGDVVEEVATPQAGGVTALPSEHEGQRAYSAEGSLEAVCRLASGKIQYRLRGTIHRRTEVDGTFTDDPSCLTGALTVRFWNGQKCESDKIDVQDCAFDGYVDSERMETYTLYATSLLKPSLSPEMGHVPQPDDGAASAPSGVITTIDSSQLAHPVFKDLVDYQPVCKIEDSVEIENHLTSEPAGDLPECGVNPLKKLPLKGVL